MPSATRPAPTLPSLLIGLLATLPLGAQERPATPEEPGWAKVLRAWIGSDHADRELLDKAARELVAGGAPALRALGDELRSTKVDDRDRRIAVETLLSSTVLEFVGNAQSAGMRYAGQYDDLRSLQPYAGRFLLGLVLDTPGWFPSDQRAALIPALRDIFPTAPEAEVLDRLTAIAKDEDFESESIREAVSFALAQWGRRGLVQTKIDKLTENAGTRRSADELHFVRALAKLHYELREYPAAATLWSQYGTGTKALGDRLAAIDEYDFACCHALAGRTDAALGAIERCADLVAAGKVDSSAEISAKMFDTDPDLRSIRDHARFKSARSRAFDTRKGGTDR